MTQPTYLSISRHGIFYFRWPLPQQEGLKRKKARLSLKTRCPDRAGDLARYLASCGRLIGENKALARLRQDKIRLLIQAYFQQSLERYSMLLNDKGLNERALNALHEELHIHKDTLNGGNEEISDVYLENHTKRFKVFSELTNEDWDQNETALNIEMRKARRDQIAAILGLAEGLSRYSFGEEGGKAHSIPPQPPSAPLEAAINDFMAEHSRQWPEKTAKQIRAYLNILLEYFGPDRLLGSITKQDASNVKKILQALPASRNTKPALKGVPLLEVVKVRDHKTISPKTTNSHIDTFRRFFDWAERHGYTPHKLFEGMKVPKAKDAATERKPFTKAQTQLIFEKLTAISSSLVRKESHKWGALLGIYTGARLNEICQLEVTDIQQIEGIWFLNITDEGGSNKRLKAKASKRKVPLHSDLIRLGFLKFVESRSKGQRLFHDYSYTASGGYGRNLGRWFNENFLPKLGIKEPSLVFHSLRHTMITRLGQAGVPEPIYQ